MSLFSLSDNSSVTSRRLAFLDMPDIGLKSLQERFQSRDLEELYKRYEQRTQIGEDKKNLSMSKSTFFSQPVKYGVNYHSTIKPVYRIVKH